MFLKCCLGTVYQSKQLSLTVYQTHCYAVQCVQLSCIIFSIQLYFKKLDLL